jgi:hypothetical protein
VLSLVLDASSRHTCTQTVRLALRIAQIGGKIPKKKTYNSGIKVSDMGYTFLKNTPLEFFKIAVLSNENRFFFCYEAEN